MIKLFQTMADDINEIELNSERFPDGSLKMSIFETKTFLFNEKYRNSLINNFIIDWRYEDDSELFKIKCIVDTLRDIAPKVDIILFMPYIPNARMDRVKSKFECFTLKSFCDIINSINFYKVYVLDAHSNVSISLLDRCENISPKNFINATLKYFDVENLIIFFPDEGAMKRYKDMITNIPYAFGIKERDWKTGKIKNLKIENEELVKGKDVLIIDDICSRGGTAMRSAAALKEKGADNIYLYVTHAENTILESDIINKEKSNITNIFTTDSILDNFLLDNHIICLKCELA